MGAKIAGQRQSPPIFLRTAMWSLWAESAATVAVGSTVAWHSRRTHRPGGSLAALEIVGQVFVAGIFALLYWWLNRSPNLRVVNNGPQGVRADTLAVMAALVTFTGMATAGCSVWFWAVPWVSSANAALLGVLAIVQLGLAGKMFRDVRRPQPPPT